MKPMNNNEFKDKLSKTIANTLNAFSSKETPKVKDKSDLALRESESPSDSRRDNIEAIFKKLFESLSSAQRQVFDSESEEE